MAEPFGVTRISDVTGLDYLTIPVAQAFRPASHTNALSQGKGSTAPVAALSAVMEAAEGWGAEHIQPDFERRSVHSLPRGYFIARYCFTNRSRHDWLKARTAFTNKPALVRRDDVDMSVWRDSAPRERRATSNGLAAHERADAAVLHALYEVFERGTLATTPEDAWTGIDVHSVPDPDIKRLSNIVRRAIGLLEVDLVRPSRHTWVARSWVQTPDIPEVHAGVSANLTPLIAVRSAIFEAVQSRLTAIAGSRDDLKSSHYGGQARRTILTERRELGPLDTVPHEPWAGHESAIRAVTQDIMTVWSEAEPLIVELCSADPAVKIVKVIAPGVPFESQTPFARLSQQLATRS